MHSLDQWLHTIYVGCINLLQQGCNIFAVVFLHPPQYINIWFCRDQIAEWHENTMRTSAPASFMFLRVGVILAIPSRRDSIFYLFSWLGEKDSWRLSSTVTIECFHLQKTHLCSLCGGLIENFFSREAGSPVQWQELWSQLHTRLSITLELAMAEAQYELVSFQMKGSKN